MLQRLRAAVHRLTAPPVAPPEPAAEPKAAAKKFGGNQGSLIGAMNAGKPGNWGGDHAKEAEHFTGWNYSAIDQLGKQALQADIHAYRDQSVFSLSELPFLRHKGRLKKVARLRSTNLRKWLALRLCKGYDDDDLEAELLPPTHPLSKILRRPNDDQTGGMFNYERVIQVRLTGCLFVWNVPNKFGQTVQRYVLPTSAMQAVEPQPGLPNGGWKVDASVGCEVDEQGFRPSTFRRLYVNGYVIPAEQVRVTGYAHPTRKDDYQSPLAAGALWIDTADMVAEARHAQLKNGGVTSLWATAPEDVDMNEEEAKAIKAAIRAELSGPQNHRAILLGAQGLDAKNLNPNATEMDYSGGHTQTRDAVLALHHTPASAIGADTPKTYGAARSGVMFYKWATVDAILCFLSDIDTEFFAPQFGKGLSVWYEAKDLEDPELELKGLQLDVAAGNAVTVNQYLLRRGYDPLDDERGEEFVGAATLPPVAPALDPFGQEKPQPDEEDEDDERGPAPFGVRRPRFSLPSANGNGKAHTNGHAKLNGHDHVADARKKAPREYLPAGAPVPPTTDDALALIAAQWAEY